MKRKYIYFHITIFSLIIGYFELQNLYEFADHQKYKQTFAYILVLMQLSTTVDSTIFATFPTLCNFLLCKTYMYSWITARSYLFILVRLRAVSSVTLETPNFTKSKTYVSLAFQPNECSTRINIALRRGEPSNLLDLWSRLTILSENTNQVKQVYFDCF